jgi:hypothetical protein
MKILEPKFVYCAGRKNLALIMLIILFFIQLLSILSGSFRVIFEIWINNFNVVQSLLETNINFYVLLFPLKEIVGSITYICFIIWFIRVYRNHQALTMNKTGNKTVSFRGFFLYLWRVITFLWIRWFWRVYEISNEVLQGKNYVVSELWQENKYEKQFINPLVFFWWVVVVLSLYYGRISVGLWEKLQNELPSLYKLPILHMAISATLFVDILIALTCILSIRLVKGIHSQQSKTYGMGKN